MQRFKIDFNSSRSWPFSLYFRRPRWHYRLTRLTWWEEINTFETQEDARRSYEKIKDLPEYLD